MSCGCPPGPTRHVAVCRHCSQPIERVSVIIRGGATGVALVTIEGWEHVEVRPGEHHDHVPDPLTVANMWRDR